MRTIKFRGKRVDKGEWVCGFVSEYQSKTIISSEIIENPSYSDPAGSWSYVSNEVIPETVGQFTGLTDKNGVDIYEGDTIKGGIRLMSVIFKQEACQFWLIWKDIDLEGREVNRYEPLTASYGDDNYCFSNDGLEVIGTIHDNPELIK